eukprot:TRINITY_DN11541_c1_g1_i1.p1 TRINITY_DN11541_c1_g1~~TRINITY_DN11541_c1_g1_i1.p1  ORF type:complete len:223 (+),score=34.46 TRINITY_DN11541_c1_g1_i1:803-1471(+)
MPRTKHLSATLTHSCDKILEVLMSEQFCHARTLRSKHIVSKEYKVVSSTDNTVNVEIHSRERPRGVFGGLDSEANTTTPSVTTYSWNKDTGCGEWNYVSAEWPALTYRGTEVVRPATADEKHSHARLMATRAQQATNKWLAEPAGQSPEPDTHQWDEEAQAVVEFSYFTQFDVPLVGGMVENVINSGAADEFPNIAILIDIIIRGQPIPNFSEEKKSDEKKQ